MGRILTVFERVRAEVESLTTEGGDYGLFFGFFGAMIEVLESDLLRLR